MQKSMRSWIFFQNSEKQDKEQKGNNVLTHAPGKCYFFSFDCLFETLSWIELSVNRTFDH